MRSRQHGFSLIELMISLVLGAIVVVAAVQLFGTNQRTFALQQSMTEVQEQGRFALDYIVRDLHRMGMVDASAITPNYSEMGVMITSTSAGGVVYPGSQEGGNVATATDRLTFAYFGTTDCEGDLSPGERVVNTYWVQSGDLVCEGSIDPGSSGLTLVSGVDTFQVLYGVDTALGDGEASAGNYLRANQLTAADIVVAVKVGLLVRARQDRDTGAATENFVVLDKALATGAAPLDDNSIRRLFTTTVKARNLNWEEI